MASRQGFQPLGTRVDQNASWPSRLIFQWVQPILRTANIKPLVEEDLFDLPAVNSSSVVGAAVNDTWRSELAALGAPSARLVRALYRAFGRRFIVATVFSFATCTSQFAGPLLLGYIVAFLQSSTESLKRGLALVAIFCAVRFFQTVTAHQAFHNVLMCGLNVRSGLSMLVFEKSLRLTAPARAGLSTGEITNLMSSDISRVSMAVMSASGIWTVPYMLVIAMIMLLRALGPSALAGLAVLGLLIPIQGYISRRLAVLMQLMLKVTDERIKTIGEVLHGIRSCKLFGWEEQMAQLVGKVRARELRMLRKRAYINALSNFVTFTSLIFVSTVTYAVYGATNPSMSVAGIVSSIALFNVLWMPVSSFARVVSELYEARVSLRRLEAFLVQPEQTAELTTVGPASEATALGSIVVQAGRFYWGGLEESNGAPARASLICSELVVRPGSLVIVVGRLGAGKSTLLAALLGQLSAAPDSLVRLAGRVAYAPQEAWLMNATLRENVVFHFDAAADVSAASIEARYQHAVQSCALAADIAMLPAGDATEIGERGISLSGGQRARVSCARVVFAEADIVLLDDPLAAVDVHVARHLVDRCLLAHDALGGKTRVLVTHHTDLLPLADLVVVVEDGVVQHVGTYAELSARGVSWMGAPVFSALPGEPVVAQQDDAAGAGLGQASAAVGNQGAEAPAAHAAAACALPLAPLPAAPGLNSGGAEAARRPAGAPALPQAPAPGVSGTLMSVEERMYGAVSIHTYLHYARAVGGLAVVLVLVVLLLAAEGMRIGQDVWLTSWMAARSPSLTHYLTIFVVFGLGNALAALARMMLFARASVTGALSMHDGLLGSILRASMSFFDTTPTGRIVARFARDFSVIDDAFPNNLQSFGQTVARALATFVLAIAVLPFFAIPAVPLIAIYLYVQRYFTNCSRELQRLDTITRSPIYALFAETLAGISTIRAFQVSGRFVELCRQAIDRNARVYWMSMSANRWLGVRLEAIGNMLVVSAALIAVLQRGRVSPALAAIAIAYVMRVIESLNWAVRMAAQVEADAVSLQRVAYYTDAIPHEAAAHTDALPVGVWPSRGQVVFDDVSMRYRDGLQLVLRQVSFTIPAGSKVGIVGRSGAGKSSLLLVLLRIVPLASGRILVDGLDIATLGLTDLRRAISLIPQTSTMFSGTLRQNLDPFGEHSDAAIWHALSLAHMVERVRRDEAGLDALMSEDGENYSTGERQLIGLARALLRRSNLVILDEATSASDYATDALVQATLRKEFAGATVLTIAHRLATIMDSDLVLVMGEGAVVEFGPPAQLLAQPDGVFAGMVHQPDPEDAS